LKWTDRIGRRVKLRDLHIVLAVAEAGSMTRAAEELAGSYPVVSKTISESERTLGVRLFDRSIAGVQPTHYGRALLKSGVAVFNEMRMGLQQIESIKRPNAGELRIGSSIVTDAGFASRDYRADFARVPARGGPRSARKTSRFNSTTSCATENLSWCSGDFPQR